MCSSSRRPHLQRVCQEEDCEVAVQGVGVLPEGSGVKGAGGIHGHLTPPHHACLYQQAMSPCQYLHLHQTAPSSLRLMFLMAFIASYWFAVFLMSNTSTGTK